MSFTIEKSQVILKHLIHVGPDVDAEAVADIAVRRNYSKQTRQLKTPQGPLMEYLFRPTNNPQYLIVFSRKGFVIDAKPVDEVLPLFRDAYDFYEKVMEDRALTATVLMDMNATFEVYSPIPVNDLIQGFYKKDSTANLSMNKRDLRPFGIVLAAGTGRFPEEFIQLTIQPFGKDPERRLVVRAMYRSTELDNALSFVENMSKEIAKTLEKIAKSSK